MQSTEPSSRNPRPTTVTNQQRVWRLAMLGFGSVGQSLSLLLLALQDRLASELGFHWSVTGVASASRGVLTDHNGLDLRSVLTHCRSQRHGWPGGKARTDQDPLELLLEESSAHILVEATPLNPWTGEPALSYLTAALNRGVHVVTCNKGPIANAYGELRELAEDRQVRLRFESTVMDGAPVFLLVERSLPAISVVGVRGTLNSTSNFVAASMEKGRSETEALTKARQLGVAEADPSFDLEGWDSATKLCVLVNVLMGTAIRPRMVARPLWPPPRGSDGTYARQVSEARIDSHGRVETMVTWEGLPQEDPLAVTGFSTALTLKTDTLKDLTITIDNPGTEQTAYGVLADILTIAGTSDRQ